jgi:hypothetical protein
MWRSLIWRNLGGSSNATKRIAGPFGFPESHTLRPYEAFVSGQIDSCLLWFSSRRSFQMSVQRSSAGERLGFTNQIQTLDRRPSSQADSSEYTNNTNYSVGSRIRVRLYNGKVVEAEITAITNQSAGREVQIVYGVVTASINPAQITEVQPTR